MARKWLGNRSATKKASATGPAPRIAASMMSRRKPVRRDTSVSPPTVRMRSIMVRPLSRHGRACPDHPRLFHDNFAGAQRRGCPGTSPGMTGRVPLAVALPAERPVDRVDGAVLGRVGEIGVDTQA